MRAQQAAGRSEARGAAARGDESFLPARDRGPVRKTVRDLVDSRRNIGSWFLAVAGDFMSIQQIAQVLKARLGDAARRGTRLIVRHPRVVGLRPGHYFGIGDRLYLVARTWQLESVRTSAAGGEMRYGTEQMQYGTDDLIYGS